MSLHFYTSLALRAGCPGDQIQNVLSCGIVLQPRQLAACAAARLCDAPDGPLEIGYGGARGGGKSHWLLAQMGADDCQRMPGLKCLLLRKVGKANLEHLQDLRQRLFRHLPHEFQAPRGILHFANGSRIVAGHFQAEKDIDSYLGLEYDVIGVEEATTLTWRKYQDIVTCCRTSKKTGPSRMWRPRIYSTTNPGNVGHAWYKERFITPFRAHRETRTRFISARVTDNPFVNPEYAEALSAQTGWQRRAWYEGDWDIAAGQFFTTFRQNVHVVSTFDSGAAQSWFAGFDFGFHHFTVFLLGCEDSRGNTWIVGEHAGRKALPATHARAMHQLCSHHGLQLGDLRRIATAGDVAARQSDGTSVAGAYRDLGIHLAPGFSERVPGWAHLSSLFGDTERGIRPRLFIHESCRLLLATLPQLQSDPNRPDDVLKVDVDEDGQGGDDAADALRYMVATRSPRCASVKLRGG